MPAEKTDFMFDLASMEYLYKENRPLRIYQQLYRAQISHKGGTTADNPYIEACVDSLTVPGYPEFDMIPLYDHWSDTRMVFRFRSGGKQCIIKIDADLENVFVPDPAPEPNKDFGPLEIDEISRAVVSWLLSYDVLDATLKAL